jgi:hypothetical protein
VKLTLGQQDPPIIFREGEICPEGYLCVPGVPPVKLPGVPPIELRGFGQEPSPMKAPMMQSVESFAQPSILSAIVKAGFDPSIFDWSTGLLKT